jgi:hypothetical protein
MVPLCSRNAHDQNVFVRRAQWGNHSAHDLKEYGERSRNARPQKALVGRAQSETPSLPSPGFGKVEMKLSMVDGS